MSSCELVGSATRCTHVRSGRGIKRILVFENVTRQDEKTGGDSVASAAPPLPGPGTVRTLTLEEAGAGQEFSPPRTESLEGMTLVDEGNWGKPIVRPITEARSPFATASG
jgi:hypothetical protein